jgi:hypothetical protein
LSRNPALRRAGSLTNTNMLKNFLTSTETITPQQVEQEMKAKLTGCFNLSSTFFWYPPQHLMTEQYINKKEVAIQENYFPGNGLSYTSLSLDQIHHKQRLNFFNNKFSQGNRFKANWRSLRGHEHKNSFIKSGVLDKKDFIIKIKSVGNLIRAIEDLMVGKNTNHEIHEYKYFDNTYYMNTLDETKQKENERKLVTTVQKYTAQYETTQYRNLTQNQN